MCILFGEICLFILEALDVFVIPHNLILIYYHV